MRRKIPHQWGNTSPFSLSLHSLPCLGKPPVTEAAVTAGIAAHPIVAPTFAVIAVAAHNALIINTA